MCTSHATFFYGLWVNFASLNFAATAHKNTRAPLLALDLIAQRRRAGKLECEVQEGKKTVVDVPEEVWAMVKHELLGIEVRQAELDTIAELRCDRCSVDKEKTLREGGDTTTVWSQWGPPPNCALQDCWYTTYDSGYLNDRPTKLLQDVTSLLASYGLELPFEAYWHADAEEYFTDFDGLSAIALPRRSTMTSITGYPFASAECHHEYGTGTSAINFSPEAFLVPSSTDRNFHRLIADYRLNVVDRTKETIVTPSQPTELAAKAKKSTEPKEKSKSGVQKDQKEQSKLYRKNQPRWMVWTMCDPCG